MYFRLDDSEIVATVEVAPGVVLDFNRADDVVGVEMLGLSTRSPGLDLTDLEFEACTGPGVEIEMPLPAG
ncbi:MAG: DUF2283 domain-containing protein [Acidimicrobiaceae bacterium]|nr:DUF2283 domain-containing protein [Acidimicrobiaceae bacterium]